MNDASPEEIGLNLLLIILPLHYLYMFSLKTNKKNEKFGGLNELFYMRWCQD